MENYEKVEEFYQDYLEDKKQMLQYMRVNNDGSFVPETLYIEIRMLQTLQ